MEIAILQNQLVIMQVLLNMTQSPEDLKKLKEQIMFTKARLEALS